MTFVWTVLEAPEARVVAVRAPAPGTAARGPETPDPAHDLLLMAAAEATGHPRADLAVTHRCPRCSSDGHGVPAITHAGTTLDLRVSLSRAPGLVIAAVGTAPGLGVDIELADAAADPALDRLLPAAHHRTPERRTRAWVRVEAALKAWGIGLNLDPAQVRDHGTTAETPADPRPARLLDLDVPGYAAALAILENPLRTPSASRG